MSRQAGLSLVGSSVLILYEGDTTVVSRDDDLKPANVSCSCLDSPALCAVKLFWLSVTLLLQESAAAPVVKLIDFENVSMNSSGACDESYLTGVRNLRWNLERLVAWGALEAAKEEAMNGMRELRSARKQLKADATKCGAAQEQCIAAAPEKGSQGGFTVAHEDIIKEEMATSVQEEEDNVIAGLPEGCAGQAQDQSWGRCFRGAPRVAVQHPHHGQGLSN